VANFFLHDTIKQHFHLYNGFKMTKQILPLVLLVISFSILSVNGQIDVRATQSEARDLAAANKFDAAIAKWDLLISNDPKQYSFFLQRAACFHAKNDHPAEWKDLTTAFTLSANNEWLENSFQAYIVKIPLDEGMRIVDSLIASDGSNFIAYRIRAVLKMSTKDHIGVIDDVLKAGDIDLPTSYRGLPMIFDSLTALRGEKEASIQYERVVVRLEHMIRDLDAQKVAATGNSFKKMKILDASRQLGTAIQALLMEWAVLCEEKGNPQEANLLLDKMVTVEPKSMAYRYRLNYFKRKGRLEEAARDKAKLIDVDIEAITTTIKDSDDSLLKALSLISRGDLYVAAKQFDKAIADYEAAITTSKFSEAKANAKIAEARRLRDASEQKP